MLKPRVKMRMKMKISISGVSHAQRALQQVILVGELSEVSRVKDLRPIVS